MEARSQNLIGAGTEEGVTPSDPLRIRQPRVLTRILSSTSGKVGVALILLLIAVALIGPFVRPHDPAEVIAPPFQPPSGEALLGTDQLGRDVLSRVLVGGVRLLAVSTTAAVLAYLIGVSIGMVAGFRKGGFDLAAIAAVDVLLSIPPIIFVLVLLTGAGSKIWIVTLGIVVVLVPGVTRISRTVTRDVATSEFVEAAVARGEGLVSIVTRELLPNLWTPLLADFGIRLAYAVILYSSLAFLGFGVQPPAADWGAMINENRPGIIQQPWAVVVPAIAIAALTIGVNLVADAYARTMGRSVVARV
jgi:peptide/nickel transport system permease protein